MHEFDRRMYTEELIAHHAGGDDSDEADTGDPDLSAMRAAGVQVR